MYEYLPFGDEWKKEVMRLKKSEIVDMLAKALRETASRPTPRAADGLESGQKEKSLPTDVDRLLDWCAVTSRR